MNESLQECTEVVTFRRGDVFCENCRNIHKKFLSKCVEETEHQQMADIFRSELSRACAWQDPEENDSMNNSASALAVQTSTLIVALLALLLTFSAS